LVSKVVVVLDLRHRSHKVDEENNEDVLKVESMSWIRMNSHFIENKLQISPINIRKNVVLPPYIFYELLFYPQILCCDPLFYNTSLFTPLQSTETFLGKVNHLWTKLVSNQHLTNFTT